MKKLLFLFTAILFVTTVWAGKAKVVKTEPTGIDFDLQDMYVTVNVKLQAANIAEDQCGLIVLMNNARWNDTNLSFQKFVELCKKTCFGDADLEAVGAVTTSNIPIVIPIERNLMTGKSETLYLKAYVVDADNEAIIAQGELVEYTPDKEALRQQMIQRSANIAGSLMGAIMSAGGSGGDGSVPDGCKQCSSCGGSGKCRQCMGKGVAYDEKCSWCHDGTCLSCHGKGYVGKDMLELMMEDDKKAPKGKGKQRTTQEDEGMGGLLEGILGW